MKKAQRKLLGELILAPLHRFQYKSFIIGSDGQTVVTGWTKAWTNGVTLFDKDVEMPLSSFKDVTTQSLKLIVNEYLNRTCPGYQYYTYRWEYATDRVSLNKNHPWYKEAENAT